MSRRLALVLLAGCLAVSTAAFPRTVSALEIGVRGPYAAGPELAVHRTAESDERLELRVTLAAVRHARRSALQIAGFLPGS